MAAISTHHEPRSPGRRWLLRGAAAVFDAGAIATALTLAAWLRFDFDLTHVDLDGLLWTVTAAISVLWSAGIATCLYFGRHPVGSLDDALAVARVNGVAGLALFVLVCLSATPPVPRSVPLTATPFAVAIALVPRLAIRSRRARQGRPDRVSARRAIVYGAGPRGQELVRAMLSGSAGDVLPIAVLDDDPARRNSRIAGVAVRGTGRDLAAVAEATGAQVLVVALTDPGPDQMSVVLTAARTAGIEVKTPPLPHELLRPWACPRDLRDLDVAELLGRRQVDTDVEAIAGYLAGKRVLVTGAGGSIGSELCRQLHRFDPAQVLMLDRDESALHAVQLSMHARARLDAPEVILADIRDAGTVRAVLLDRRPDVVFHAAALKHLPVLERHPAEAWKTNVLGTLTLLGAARLAGVEVFVNISTDKAANPVSVLGRSKRIGERLVADAARRAAGTYLSVRFGNVLGSRGSVLTTFAGQLATGRPVTVTHPEATRFFMTVPEAVQLVIQAAAIGSSGEALVLDMGEPARITDLAQLLMTICGKRSPIIFTGLSKGEKVHEELFGDGEVDHRPVHPAISHIAVPPLAPETLRARAAVLGHARAMAVLVAERAVTAPGENGAVRTDVPAPLGAGAALEGGRG
ncbi:nucleoside-diphosphate sugar epimerase/dehydratase [Amycolatopsis alkalitolerans]|uniref:Polysaccharide biosynthesis protein n=1 Tax=Amycolatopsis alkalitolerans TaxID=2547244 RepID=A0A5C4LSD4_9PSEU|nr:nucleoside-diphosphate sugar epimerase/dehydratase [Amycolatopsis alkalitolerans]TNC21880.1 polysaccharide biosynthesis protein [Amycolatopsis alkalitolerans]